MISDPTVLVVDDDPDTCEMLSDLLRREAVTVLTACTGHEALERYERGVDVVLLDYRLPDMDGFTVLRRMRQLDPSCPVMVVTGHGGIEHAVEALQLGSNDYATKPVPADQVSRFVREAVAGGFRKGSTPTSGVEAIRGSSAVIRRLRSLLRRIARSGAAVLLTGERGTGKRLAARALHEESARADGPFSKISCTAQSPERFEAELFGRTSESGDAAAGKPGLLERARGGTVLLDGIADMTPQLQGKLLRVVEDGTFRRVGGETDRQADVRIVSSTTIDLRRAVSEGRFREDLYDRLGVFVVEIPPLRHRPGDVEVLARRFVLRLCRREGRPPPSFTPDALDRLRAHTWPGNVRELRNVIERAVLPFDGQRLDAESFDRAIDTPDTERQLDLPPSGIDLREFERRMVEQALLRSQGNITRAAAMLGLNRDQMRYRVAKFGLDPLKAGPSRR